MSEYGARNRRSVMAQVASQSMWMDREGCVFAMVVSRSGTTTALAAENYVDNHASLYRQNPRHGSAGQVPPAQSAHSFEVYIGGDYSRIGSSFAIKRGTFC